MIVVRSVAYRMAGQNCKWPNIKCFLLLFNGDRDAKEVRSSLQKIVE